MEKIRDPETDPVRKRRPVQSGTPADSRSKKMKYEDAVKKLSEYGQEHVLRFYETLDEGEKEALLRQIDETDFSVISALGNEKENIKRGVITPLAAMRADEIESRKEIFREEGLAAIRAGKVAAVLLAGGMGTRLGSPDPKGMYDIGISRHVYIFQRLIENMLDVVREAGCFFHLYVMTSEKNDEKTRTFFKEHDYFGYDPAFIAFFCQDNAPTVDFNGKVLMESKGRISTSPNGNGGWMKSLERAGLLQEMHREGVEWLNTFSVDNVLQKICDPVFVGATILSGRDSGSKVVRKANPEEAIGVICSEDGRTAVVEYSELSEEMRYAKDDSGDYAYYYGVILNYLFSLPAAEKVMNDEMTNHIARKKIACIDEEGNAVKPETPNGCKFELFIFDLLKGMNGCLPFEVVRSREFAPVKNKEAPGINISTSGRSRSLALAAVLTFFCSLRH